MILNNGLSASNKTQAQTPVPEYKQGIQSTILDFKIPRKAAK